MKRRWLPRYVTVFKDRHGGDRFRFRKTGSKTYYFKHRPGTDAFLAELRACEDGTAAPSIEAGLDRVVPGSVDDLLVRYYGSPDFLDPAEKTRRNYRRILEHWRARSRKGIRYGEIKVRDLRARHIELMLAELLPHRTAANMLRKRLFALMRFAIRAGMATANPVAATRPFKVSGSGYHTWTEAEIAAYRTRHPLGTTARLALELMLCTGQRGGDARVIGPAHIVGNRIELTQQKTGAFVSLPILPELAEALLATPLNGTTFLRSAAGPAFTEAGFRLRIRGWCDEADLKQCSAHGLRKAAARRFAEAGCSNQEIKSWTGHTTDAEIARYTAAADKRHLSDAAAIKLLANLKKELAKDQAK